MVAVRQDIADSYYDKLVKPTDAKYPPQFCLCVVGLVGAGKTSLLKKIAERLSFVRMAGDEIRYLFYERGEKPANVIELGAIVAHRLLREGYNVAYDSDFCYTEARKQRAATNAMRGITELWIRVTPPEEFILNKLRHYNHSWLFKDADAAIAEYYRRKQLHQEQKVDQQEYLYTFDTSRDDLDKQVAEFVSLARQKLDTIKAGEDGQNAKPTKHSTKELSD